MIYDKVLTVCDLLPASSPLQRRLRVTSSHYYCEREVYASRFYAGKQAGVQLTRMVSIPRVFGGEDIRAEQFAELEDGHIYRIDQAQRGYDADGLPITTLSLAEPEGKYEILQDSDGA